MVKIDRVDSEGSFTTLLKFIDGKETQEIHVYVWEADAIETALKSMSLSQVEALRDTTGDKTIKEW